jgi:acyl-coenzyme A thioesterase PaaI-like protein
MHVTKIPFNNLIGITRHDKNINELKLPCVPELKNHLGTVHASAQFALAEACSGSFLLQRYPHLADMVIPVVRKADVKFKKPATGNLTASASIDSDDEEHFIARLTKKGRSSIPVSVKVEDHDGTVTAVATYEWFIQKK